MQDAAQHLRGMDLDAELRGNNATLAMRRDFVGQILPPVARARMHAASGGRVHVARHDVAARTSLPSLATCPGHAACWPYLRPIN